MKLKHALEGVSVTLFTGDTEAEITEISYSSKTVQPGHLFAALQGEKRDGFFFIDDAVQKGAAAVLSERDKPESFPASWIQVPDAREALALCSANFFMHPSRRIKVLGVTGTKGKTTVTYLLEAILKSANFKPGIIGTISYHGPGVSQPAERTTPEAPELQRLMNAMLNHGATHCVMEISSHSLELRRAHGTEIHVAVFTNLSGEHLDYHKTMESYFHAKKKLFTLSQSGKAVINTDDPWGKRLIPQLTMEAISFGLSPGAMVQAEEYRFLPDGIKAKIKSPAGSTYISSQLLGKPNLYNILAAAASALALDLPPTCIREGIASVKGVPGRFEKIRNSLGLNIFVDYAHTDDALRNLLETAKEISQGRILVVFGAGGDRDKSKRARMGEIAGHHADWTIITSDNPRSEDPSAIISDIEKGIKKSGPGRYEIEPERRTAIQKAIAWGGEGDFILIAGKGHERYQVIKDKIIPFDDVEVTKELLKKQGEA